MATGGPGPSKGRSNVSAEGAELSDDQMNSIYEAFAVFDVEKNGIIATQNLKMAMRALGFEPRREEIKKIISECVKDESDSITLEQFVSLMTEKIADKGAKEEIFKAFCLFDDDNTGKITFKNLKRVAEELGETLSEEELREMIVEADQDNDGEISQDEFLRIMKKTCLY